jgi:hypothetical protein
MKRILGARGSFDRTPQAGKRYARTKLTDLMLVDSSVSDPIGRQNGEEGPDHAVSGETMPTDPSASGHVNYSVPAQQLIPSP